MTQVLAAPTALLGSLATLETQGSPQTPVRAQVLEVQGLAEMLALNRVRYADVNTAVPAALRNGSIAYPFATVAAAIAALPTGGVVLVAPGSYTEPAINIPAACPISLVALGPRSAASFANVIFANSVLSSSDIAAVDCTFTNALLTSQRAVVDNCQITNLTAAGDSRIYNSAIQNLSVTAGLVQIFDTNVGGTCSVVNAEMWGSNFNGATASGTLVSRSSIFAAAVSAAAANIWKTRFGLALTVTGNLVTDYDSVSNIVASVTAGSITVNGTAAPKVTLPVNVPGVGDGEVAYVTVSLVGTKLEGLVPAGSLLVANPTTDLEAAGPGGGFTSIRCNAANSARLAFIGPLTGGAGINFLVGVV